MTKEEKTMRYLRLATIAVVIATLQLTAFGQETAVGKKLAQSFWKAVAKGQVFTANSNLKSIKRREPAFDTSKMEKALEDIKAKKVSRRESSRNALDAKINSSNSLATLFERNLQADNSTALESVKADIEKHRKLAEELSIYDRSKNQKDYDDALTIAKSVLKTNDEKIAGLRKKVKQETVAENAEVAYYALLMRQSYWDNARKVFPDETEFGTAHSSISKIVGSLGSPEDRAANAKKALNAKIDSARLPNTATKDAVLENLFKRTFITESRNKNRKFTFLKAVVTSSAYQIRRNSLTGIILGRKRYGIIALKDANGICKYGEYVIYQNYVGGRFSSTTTGSFGSLLSEIRCANVRKE